jgi:hypothetical protein
MHSLKVELSSINLGQEKPVLDFTNYADNVTWYFMGDIHGDPRCLNWVFKFLKSLFDFRFCFLGDLFDRGPDAMLCLKMMIQFAEGNPGKVFWIAGNHDVPYKDRPNPCAYINDQNAMDGHTGALRNLPVIALFPNAIVATHGGWKSDTFKDKLTFDREPTELQKRTLQTARLCLLDSDSYAPELDGLTSFCPKDLEHCKVGRSGNSALKLLIRGHDHPSNGFDLFKEKGFPQILTLLASTQIGVHFYPDLHRKWTTVAAISNWEKVDVLRVDATLSPSTVAEFSL